MPITARQIARMSGLSNATVSRVLNNTQYVSPEARAGVMAVISEVGQTPRLLGRRRPNGSRSELEFVEILTVNRYPANPYNEDVLNRAQISGRSINESGDARQYSSYTRHIIDGIVAELRHVGLLGIVQSADSLRDPALLAQANKPGNRGLFLLGNYDEDVLDFVERCRCPIVSFMTWDHNGWPDYVGIDNITGIRIGLRHLLELGHTKIGYVAGALRYTHVFRQRLTAFKLHLTEAGLRWRNEWISEGSCDLGPMQTDIERILRRKNRPTAIVCAFDGAALAIRRAADSLGLRIPSDLSVVGFDDESIAQLFSPPLTTVRVPTDMMGRHAVHLMAMRQRRPIARGEGVSIRVTPTLTIRESTSPPRGE